MIKIFFYVYQVKNWKSIYDEIILEIKNSKIPYQQLYILSHKTKIDEKRLKNISLTNNGRNEYEFFALKKMFDYINPNDKVLYLHTKGVTRQHPNINAWRKYMLHFCVTKYQQCINILNDYEACGTDLKHNSISLHEMLKNSKSFKLNPRFQFFVGNFWWATGNHLFSLPKFNNIKITHRWAAERWIGMHNNAKLYSLHTSRKDLYKTRINEKEYKG